MPTLKSLVWGYQSIPRADKDPLTLGPRETADISDVEFDSDEIQRHLRERRIAVIPGAQADRGGRNDRGGGRPRTDTGRGSGPSTPTPTE